VSAGRACAGDPLRRSHEHRRPKLSDDMVKRRRLLAPALAAPAAAALAFPADADAHGIVGKADLPIPVWLFSWAAAIVLVASFVGLAALWTRPQLQSEHRIRIVSIPQAARIVVNLIGVGFFFVVVYSGLAGTQVWSANFSVTFIYVLFWVGTPVASAFLGNIFAAFSPWRSVARGLRWSCATPSASASGRPSRP
jgi:hypothetical protein